jgi:hypothetical protein
MFLIKLMRGSEVHENAPVENLADDKEIKRKKQI